MDKKLNPRKYPPHMRMDIERRNKNIDSGETLCERCSGTGNELYSMYSRCTECNGAGFKQALQSGSGN